jgi:PQQ enzyme-like repeat protein/putative pyrroloquinoline-quinone-binding quinoprotein
MKNISCLLIVLAALFSLPSQARAADIAFVAAASAGAASGTLTINKPTGTLQNHVMIASIGLRPNTATITPPSGWTLVRRVDNANATASSLAVYYKVAGGSEGASYAWTFSTSAGSAGGIQTFSGVDPTTPIDVESGQNTASSLTHASPSVTTTVARAMIVTSYSFASAATWTPPSGMTEGFDVASIAVPNVAGQSIEGDYVLQTAAGATGAKTATASNDADVGNTHILALRPPAGIAFVAAASAGAASGTLTLTINKPTGTLQNHVMIASIGVRPNTATITPPSGWTLVQRVDNANATASSLAVYYKVAGASEGASYAWTFNTSTGSAGGIQTFSGVETTAPIEAEDGQNTASSLTHATPSVTTTTARTMIVTSYSFATAATWTPPSGMTEGFDVASGAIASTGQSTEGSYVLQTTPGATGAKTATASNDADVANTHILALAASRQWNYATAAASLSPPALDPWSNLVLSGSNDNKLHGMYDADGAAAISPFATGGPVQARPAVLPAAYSSTGLNITYVTSQDGFVYAINTSTGAQVWKSTVPGSGHLQGGANVWISAFTPSFLICGTNKDVVFVGTYNTGTTTANKIYALNGHNANVTTTGGGNCTSTTVVPGGVLWTYTGGSPNPNMDIITSTPFVDLVNYVWVTSRGAGGTSQPSVWKLNASNGTLASGTSTWNLGDVDASPTPNLNGSLIFVGTNAGTLKAIRVSDGTVFTHTPASGSGAINGMPWPLWYDAVGSGGETIIFTLDTTVHSVNFNGSTFTANWTKTLTGTPTLSAPVDDGANHLYVGGSSGKVHQIDADTGNNEKTVPTTAISGTMGDPTFNWDQSRLHVGGTDGHIYTFTTPF